MLSAIQKLILAFVTLILGAVLIGTIATNSLDVTAKTNIDDETHDLTSCVASHSSQGWVINESDADCNVTVTNYPTSWKVQDCPLTSVVVKNGTKTPLTVDTDYVVFDSSGVVKLKNTTATRNLTGNDTFLYYTYCGDDYLNSGFGRSTLNMVAGFFAIALLGVSLLLFYSLAKEYDVF